MSKKEWTGEPYLEKSELINEIRDLRRKLDIQEHSYNDAVNSYEKLRMSYYRLQDSYDRLFDAYCARGGRIVDLTEQITALKQERDDLAAMLDDRIDAEEAQSEPEPDYKDLAHKLNAELTRRAESGYYDPPKRLGLWEHPISSWIKKPEPKQEPKIGSLCPTCGALKVQADHGFKFSLPVCPVCDK